MLIFTPPFRRPLLSRGKESRGGCFQFHGKVGGVRFTNESSGVKKSRFADEQIVGFLKQVETGSAVKDFGPSAG